MNKSLKAIKKKVDNQLQQEKLIRDDQNRVVVDMIVQDDKHILSEFSEGKTPVINTKVAEFIENATAAIPAKEHLTLRISSDCIDDEEKGLYGKGIKEYYKGKYVETQRSIKESNIIALILIAISVALLVVTFFLKSAFSFDVWAEIINIIAWFFLWEATAILSLKTRDLRHKRNKYLSYISIKVEYQPLEKNEN
ncbi:MAG: hypothetical protein IJW32_03535 [Clostridia bacterium]|nr:hypothetical protein [Clostridia bacterium]